jgi:hypothetical protein
LEDEVSKNLLLDKNTNELILTNGNLTFTDSFEQNLAQKIQSTLLTFSEEWYLNQTVGVPYYSSVLGKQSMSDVNAVFVSVIKGIEGVAKIIEFEVDFDGTRRTYKITKLTVTSTEGTTVDVGEITL